MFGGRMMRNNRWTNWDQLAVGTDFWDQLDEMDEERRTEMRGQRQDEKIRAAHERRLAKMKFDPEKVRAEPFGDTKRLPSVAFAQRRPRGSAVELIRG